MGLAGELAIASIITLPEPVVGLRETLLKTKSVCNILPVNLSQDYVKTTAKPV